MPGRGLAGETVADENTAVKRRGADHEFLDHLPIVGEDRRRQRSLGFGREHHGFFKRVIGHHGRNRSERLDVVHRRGCERL
jgi:hypothetical protein